MSEDAIIILFGIIPVVGLIIFAIYKAIKSYNEEVEIKEAIAQREAWESKARAFSENLKQKVLKQFLADNHITMSEYSHSSLGLCGVSDEYLYYGLDKYEPSYFGDVYVREECAILAKKILLNSITFFRIDGSLHYTSNVEGGDVNMAGAVAGAVLGGGAAAIIGSQLGTGVKTSVVKHDKRTITIYYDNQGKIDTLRVDSFNFDETVSALRKLIPNKEETIVQMEAKKINNL